MLPGFGSFAVYFYHLFKTAQGHAAIAWNERGISSFRLPASTQEETKRSLLRRLPDAVETPPSDAAVRVVEAAQRYFAGEQVDFSQVAIDMGAQDPLFARIYQVVRGLGWGETTTYGEVAKALGEGPEVARDVGQAMARNPIPLIVPCHRVLAAGRKIGGFSAPGGSDAKARMLALEGVRPHADAPTKPSAQTSFAF